MALKKEQRTIRLTFGDDWIDVYAERTYKDTVEAQRAAAAKFSASRKDRAAAAQIDFDIGAYNLSLLSRMIVAWSDPSPINDDTIQELPDDIIQEVLNVILKMTDEDRAPLGSSSTSASESPDESSPLEEKTLAGPST